MHRPDTNRETWRLLAASSMAVGLIAAVLALPAGGQDDGHDHDHSDPATKNAVSRGGDVSAATQDPTTARQARDAAAYVASQRRLRDPRLTTVRPVAKRTRVPATRYALAGGCYTLRAGGEPFRFRATDLGSYLIIDRDQRFLAADGSRAAAPSPATEWTARGREGRMRFSSGSTPPALGSRDASTPRRRAAAQPSPRPRSTSAAVRTPASPRSRRCAGTSTRTPTGRHSSSSGDPCTAASRGTSTARSSRSSTAPTS